MEVAKRMVQLNRTASGDDYADGERSSWWCLARCYAIGGVRMLG